MYLFGIVHERNRRMQLNCHFHFSNNKKNFFFLLCHVSVWPIRQQTGKICFDGNLAKNNSQDIYSFFFFGRLFQTKQEPFFFSLPKDDRKTMHLEPTSFLTLTAISFRRFWFYCRRKIHFESPPSCFATLNFVCP